MENENQKFCQRVGSKLKLLTLIFVYFSFSILFSPHEVSASPCLWVPGWTVHNDATNPYSIQYLVKDCYVAGPIFYYDHHGNKYDQGKYVYNYDVINMGIVTTGIPFLVTPEYLGTTDRTHSYTTTVDWSHTLGFTKSVGICVPLFKGLTGNASVSTNWDSGTSISTPVPYGPATLADKSYFYADVNVHLWDMRGRYYTEWYNNGVLDHMDVISDIQHIYKWQKGLDLPPIEVPIPAPVAVILASIGVGSVGWLRRRRTL